MKRRAMPYPCVGYCIIDSRGYCTACGRPPSLGAPENSAIGKVSQEVSENRKNHAAPPDPPPSRQS